MDFLNDIFKYKNNLELVGLTDELNIFCVLNKYKQDNKNIIILTSSLFQANVYYEKLLNYTSDVALFPMDDFITSVALAVSPELKLKRLETLEKIKNNKKLIIVTNLMGYLHFLPDIKAAEKLNVVLTNGLKINRESLIEILDKFGYVRTSLTTATGDYSVRGFVIDIFIIDEIHPIRIEFFGNEIESIRYFDESTQLSINEISEINCLPNKEIDTLNKSSIYEYLQEPLVFFIDDNQINNEYNKINSDILEYQSNKENNQNKLMFTFNDINVDYKMYLNHFDSSNRECINYDAKDIDNFNSNFDLLKTFIDKKISNKKTIILCLSRISEVDIIQKMYPSLNMVNDEKLLVLDKVNILKKKINHGFEINNYVVISEFDIEKIRNTNNIKYKNTLKMGQKIKGFDELQIGDYVVHYAHGIGIYGGVTTLMKNGIKKDFLVINYANNDKVYVPVEKISTIYKYTSKDGERPKINKLNSISWERTKQTLKKKIHDISQTLIKLYAERASVKGPAFSNKEMEDLFSNGFEYELTDDQKKSINDIYKDLESSIPMDRLLCGDVGFGKTEVAFRAMFRSVINGYQVSYLCPTTILSNQQYENAIVRFGDFPISIALLNRFTTPKEVERVLLGLKEGTIDIVFGTHRLLSKDIRFKRLGLLVVDEEQRFGVTHKEKIKEMKKDVNVLTLSATPIPRTLKMALSGLRDLSIIDTAPVNRYPVQTYVLAENEMVIKDAIYKELARHGQIFILYNKVATIESKVYDIQTMIPEARIIYAHGQMNKSELENIMADFIDYKYDILICTTIIETGIDIPNANTLMVFDSDRFGLSQLYQLRGRVGRSNRIAYAYLMYNKNKMLNDIAIKRLQAIKEFTELGSGYRIAMRDLALRGAGDVLGSEQAGFVSDVGLDLYMKLVDEEIRRINGEEIPEEDESNKSLVDVETHISDSYVSDEDLKIEIHQKINEIDSYDKLVAIKEELEDRFGKINDNIEIYMYEEWFEKIALKLNIKNVKQNDHFVEVTIPSEIVEKVKFDKIFMEAYEICSKFSFKNQHGMVIITLSVLPLKKHFIYYLVALFNLILEEYQKNS